MSTVQVNRWRIYCDTESKYVDGYLNRDSGDPTVCFNNSSHTIDTTKTTLIEVIKNDHTQNVIKWKIHCDTEAIDVEGYSNKEYGSPTKCYNNNTHTISGTPEILEIIHNASINIIEDTKPIAGHLRVETIKISILPWETKIVDKNWVIDIAPLSVQLLTTHVHTGDTLQVDVSPGKIIGVATQDIAATDTVINVSPTVMQHASIGFPSCITDGVTTNEAGMITDIDRVNNTITVETALTDSFLASSPTYVSISARFLGPHEFSNTVSDLTFGATKLGASHVPKGETVRVTYVNNSPNYKDLYILIEYLY